MDKIYRRATQPKESRVINETMSVNGTEAINATKPKRKKNEHNRTRNVFLNFRMTQKERDLIETRIKLSGLTKSEFFIQSCLYQAVLVKGNIRTFSEIKNSIREIQQCLNVNSDLTALEGRQLESLRIIVEILDRLFGSDESTKAN